MYMMSNMTDYIHYSIIIINLIESYKDVILRSNTILQKIYTLKDYPYLVRQGLLYI